MARKATADPPLSEGSRVAMDPSKIPPELHPLIPFVQRWSAVCSDSERYDVADFADEDDNRIAELYEYASMWTPQIGKTFADWADNLPLTESKELCKFYFLSMMLDEMEIRTPVTDRPDPVSRSRADLVVMDGIGAEARRVFAARKLCECEADAREAIPDLERATADPSDNVRAWAHAALAVITGEVAEHRKAIEEIRSKPKLNTELIDFTDDALAELAKSSAERVNSRLTGAAITNDVATIRLLLARNVDPQTVDRDGQTAIEFAVGNGHPEAAKILLESGCDPNHRDKRGEPLLHAAACRRDPRLVEMLLAYGADPRAKDKKRQTALKIADSRRSSARAAALIRAALDKRSGERLSWGRRIRKWLGIQPV